MSIQPPTVSSSALPQKFQALLAVSEAIATHRNLEALFGDLHQRLRSVVEFDGLVLILHEPTRNTMRLHLIRADPPVRMPELLELPLAMTPAGLIWKEPRPLVIDVDREDRFPHLKPVWVENGLHSICCLILATARRRIGVITFASRQQGTYDHADFEFLELVARQVAIAVENALAFQEIAELRDKLAQEKLYLEDEIRSVYQFEEIVGDSPALQRILNEVAVVAPTDSAVLIQGETGTGKELIARALHNRSERRPRTFVKINCAAIPTGLLESELFGHEKGAFTGAIAQKIGRFELAHQGTLFLDEVGDIPTELQPKLLRVLQEKEFERLGSTRTIKVDVRLVAATNRDLTRLVAERQFRSDLFYRLNVFPIQLPPLRERREDIPVLVRYFVERSARRLKKTIATIPVEAMTALCHYPWPGNIRELENFIERAVILSRGPELHVSLAELKAATETPTDPLATLEAAEREHILRVLRETNWVVGGSSGAAARLGMKRTTLQSKMQKLGIVRPG